MNTSSSHSPKDSDKTDNTDRKFGEQKLTNVYWLKFCVWLSNSFHFDVVEDISFIFLVSLGFIILLFFGTRSLHENKIISNSAIGNIKINYEIKVIEVIGLYGVIVGLFYNAKTSHSQYHQEKFNKSSAYVAQWYSPELKKHLKLLRKLKKDTYEVTFKNELCPSKEENKSVIESVDSLLNKVRKGKNKEEIEKIQAAMVEVQAKVIDLLKKTNDENPKDSIIIILEFFEQMGQDIRFNIADEEYLRDFFFYIVVAYYEILKGYIDDLQSKYNSRYLYCNFINLAKRWEYLGPCSRTKMTFEKSKDY